MLTSGIYYMLYEFSPSWIPENVKAQREKERKGAGSKGKEFIPDDSSFI